MAHPVEQRREPFRLGAVVDVAAFRAARRRGRPASDVLRCCETAPWVTPEPRVSSTTVISSAPAMRSKTARRVGSASARMTALTADGSIMGFQLASTKRLVNTNCSAMLEQARGPFIWLSRAAAMQLVCWHFARAILLSPNCLTRVRAIRASSAGSSGRWRVFPAGTATRQSMIFGATTSRRPATASSGRCWR